MPLLIVLFIALSAQAHENDALQRERFATLQNAMRKEPGAANVLKRSYDEAIDIDSNISLERLKAILDTVLLRHRIATPATLPHDEMAKVEQSVLKRALIIAPNSEDALREALKVAIAKNLDVEAHLVSIAKNIRKSRASALSGKMSVWPMDAEVLDFLDTGFLGTRIDIEKYPGISIVQDNKVIDIIPSDLFWKMPGSNRFNPQAFYVHASTGSADENGRIFVTVEEKGIAVVNIARSEVEAILRVPKGSKATEIIKHRNRVYAALGEHGFAIIDPKNLDTYFSRDILQFKDWKVYSFAVSQKDNRLFIARGSEKQIEVLDGENLTSIGHIKTSVKAGLLKYSERENSIRNIPFDHPTEDVEIFHLNDLNFHSANGGELKPLSCWERLSGYFKR